MRMHIAKSLHQLAKDKPLANGTLYRTQDNVSMYVSCWIRRRIAGEFNRVPRNFTLFCSHQMAQHVACQRTWRICCFFLPEVRKLNCMKCWRTSQCCTATTPIHWSTEFHIECDTEHVKNRCGTVSGIELQNSQSTDCIITPLRQQSVTCRQSADQQLPWEQCNLVGQRDFHNMMYKFLSSLGTSVWAPRRESYKPMTPWKLVHSHLPISKRHKPDRERKLLILIEIALQSRQFPIQTNPSPLPYPHPWIILPLSHARNTSLPVMS